jgi:hypothetical protein
VAVQPRFIRRQLHTSEVVRRANSDPAFAEKLKADPVGTLGELPDVLQTDPWIYRGIVLALGLVAAGGLFLVAWLALEGKDIPEIFTAAISAAIGAMAGLLVPHPSPGS